VSLDYRTIAAGRLTHALADKPLVAGMVGALVAPLAGIEDNLDAIGAGRWIDNAVGAQLDGCGTIANVVRAGRDDEQYRAAIKFQITITRAGPTPPAMIAALEYLTNPRDAQYYEARPATVVLFTDGSAIPDGIQATMQAISPAGIADVPVLVSYSQKPFRFSRPPANRNLAVTGGYLSTSAGDLKVSGGALDSSASTLGGLSPAELWIGGAPLAIGGAVYALGTGDTAETGYFGDEVLTGVFQ
jgi:hypothetical protein